MRSASVLAASNCTNFLLATRSMCWKRAAQMSCESARVSSSRNDRITRSGYYASRHMSRPSGCRPGRTSDEHASWENSRVKSRPRVRFHAVLVTAMFVLAGNTRAWTPPGRAVHVSAGDSVQVIQAAIDTTGEGNFVIFAPGEYRLGKTGLRGAKGVCLYFAGTATLLVDAASPPKAVIDLAGLTGCRVYGRAPGEGPVLSGPINLDHTVRCEVANITWRGTRPAGYEGSALRASSSLEARIINCDFQACDGNLVVGWGADRCLLEGNHFADFHQGISLHWTNTATVGRDIIIRRNWFTGARRVALEMGPGGVQRTENMLVEWNYFDDFNNRGGEQWCTLMAISLVAQGAVNSVCRYNACRRGPKPANWPSSIGVEWTGSGECHGNWVFGFNPGWAFMMYGSGWNVHDNIEVDCPWPDVNNGKGTGVFGTVIRKGEFPDIRRDPRFARRPYPR